MLGGKCLAFNVCETQWPDKVDCIISISFGYNEFQSGSAISQLPNQAKASINFRIKRKRCQLYQPRSNYFSTPKDYTKWQNNDTNGGRQWLCSLHMAETIDWFIPHPNLLLPCWSLQQKRPEPNVSFASLSMRGGSVTGFRPRQHLPRLAGCLLSLSLLPEGRGCRQVCCHRGCSAPINEGTPRRTSEARGVTWWRGGDHLSPVVCEVHTKVILLLNSSAASRYCIGHGVALFSCCCFVNAWSYQNWTYTLFPIWGTRKFFFCIISFQSIIW